MLSQPSLLLVAKYCGVTSVAVPSVLYWAILYAVLNSHSKGERERETTTGFCGRLQVGFIASWPTFPGPVYCAVKIRQLYAPACEDNDLSLFSGHSCICCSSTDVLSLDF